MKKVLILVAVAAMAIGGLTLNAMTVAEMPTSEGSDIICKCRIFRSNTCSARGWSGQCNPNGVNNCVQYNTNCG